MNVRPRWLYRITAHYLCSGPLVVESEIRQLDELLVSRVGGNAVERRIPVRGSRFTTIRGWRAGVMDIELANAVAVVREELLEAARRGVGQEVGFAVGPIEMEFAVELRADAKAKLGFKAWVFASAEVGAEVARGRTQKVKITLTPKRADGGDLLIAAAAEGSVGPGDVSDRIGR